MPGRSELKITPALKREIVKIIDSRIAESHVTREDFSELKAIVKDLSIAQKELVEVQKRTEIKVEELAEAQKRTEIKVEELAEAQKRTEIKVEELAEAQKRTEIKVEELVEVQKRTEREIAELTESQKQLVTGLTDTRQQLGGLSRSFSYAFENEAYRYVPKVLQEKYGYLVTLKLVRAEVRGKEINFFGNAVKDGSEVYIVGESKIRLDDSTWRKGVFEELEDKVEAVKKMYGNVPILKLLVTHFATTSFIIEAEKRGIIVIQSFEW